MRSQTQRYHRVSWKARASSPGLGPSSDQTCTICTNQSENPFIQLASSWHPAGPAAHKSSLGHLQGFDGFPVKLASKTGEFLQILEIKTDHKSVRLSHAPAHHLHRHPRLLQQGVSAHLFCLQRDLKLVTTSGVLQAPSSEKSETCSRTEMQVMITFLL